MSIEDLKRMKKESGLSNSKISDMSGIPLGTVQKIFSGATETPRYETILKLERFFDKICNPKAIPTLRLSEPTAPYLADSSKKQGEFTLTDYYALPDDVRCELIDGVIYDMTAPYTSHQMIVGYFFNQLFQHIKLNNGNCLPFISPFDVQLDCNDKTLVEPDVIIICDRSKIIRRGLYGAPDFVLEVLSKSTKKKDMFIKLNKYMNAGVREYWMIDPATKQTVVYDFEHDKYPQIFGATDIVPVSVLNCECKIDLKELFDYIAFLPEDDD